MKFATMVLIGAVKAQADDILNAEVEVAPVEIDNSAIAEVPIGSDFYDFDYEDDEVDTFEFQDDSSIGRRQLSHEDYSYSSYSSYSYYSYYSYYGYYYSSYSYGVTYSYSPYSSYYYYSSYSSYSSYSEDDYYYGEQYDDEDWEDDDDEGYDWSMIEDMTGGELTEEDEKNLNDMVEGVKSLTQFATRATLGVMAGVSALVMSQ